MMNFKDLQLIAESMRPRQWSKNLLLFAGLIFSQSMQDTALLLKVSVAFFLFCLLTAGAYLINDIIDRESDAQNPLKNKRPIASGRLKVKYALISSGLLLALSISASFILDTSFGCITGIYLITQILYFFWLKKLIIIDIFAVVFSYLLRVVAGTILVKVEISPWLLVCTILLSLFLILCKRRHELVCLGDDAQYSRSALGAYNTALLDQMISIVTSATIVSYCLYTMSEQTIRQTGTKNLVFTIPLVIYGIFRYLYLVYKKTQGGYPEETLLRDKPLLISILLWIGSIVLFLYF